MQSSLDTRNGSRRWLIDGAWAAVLLVAVAVVVGVDAAADRDDNRRAAKDEGAGKTGDGNGENLLADGGRSEQQVREATSENPSPSPMDASSRPSDAQPVAPTDIADGVKKDSAKPQAEDDADLAAATGEPQTAPPPEVAETTPASAPASTEPASTQPPPTVATTQPPPPQPPTTTPPEQPATTVEWKLAEKDVLYQEVEIDRRSAFQVQGLPISTTSKYRVLSKVVVEKTEPDGTRVLRQTVLDARLDAADDLSKATMGGALKALKGREFVITFGPHMELLKFEGQGDPPQAVPLGGGEGGKGLDLEGLGLDGLGLEGLDGLDLGGLGLGQGMQGMFVSSAIDDDGWKEIAALSFFQPDKPPKYLGQWERPMKHDWGGLGSWAGKTTYKYKGQADRGNDDVHRIEYRHAMKYAPPGKDAPALPITVTDARFQPREAAGEILFDARAGRVVTAAEIFHVQGQLAVALLGQNTTMALEERQAFKVRIHDENPWAEQGK